MPETGGKGNRKYRREWRGARDASGLSLGSDEKLESRVLGNQHARFGEGRQEKVWKQNLAYRLLYNILNKALDRTVGHTGTGKHRACETLLDIGPLLSDSNVIEQAG